jgi:hypothetical protein
VAYGWNRAVTEGMTQGWGGTNFTPQTVNTLEYQTINHGVEPKANALGANTQCGVCHSAKYMTGGPPRMDLKSQLGYALRTDIRLPQDSASNGNWTCSVSCHGSKTANFERIHSVSNHVSRGCRACHTQLTSR